MSPANPFPPGLRLLARLLAAALLLGGASAAIPGLDAPEAIAPFLNGKFPAEEPSAAGE